MTAASHAAFSTESCSPRLSAQWCHWDRSEVQSEPSGGGRTWCPFTQRRHLILQQGQGKVSARLLCCFSVWAVSNCSPVTFGLTPLELDCQFLNSTAFHLNTQLPSGVCDGYGVTHNLKSWGSVSNGSCSSCLTTWEWSSRTQREIQEEFLLKGVGCCLRQISGDCC